MQLNNSQREYCSHSVPPKEFATIFGMETKLNHTVVRDLACIAAEYHSHARYH